MGSRVVAMTLLLASTMAVHAACPGRLVTLGGDVTEIVFALGLGECVVADDTTSDYPAAAARLDKVGYLRALNAEGVLALRPDRVIGSDEVGPPAVVDQLRAAGVHVVLVPEAHTAAGVLRKINAVAATLHQPAADARLQAAVRSQLKALKKDLSSVERRVRVLFLLTVGGGSPMAAGRDTAAAGIIALAGGVNAVQRFSGYKPVSAEALAGLAPDVVLVMSDGLDTLGGKAGILSLPGVALTPAGRSRRVIAMDGSFLLGFGPRVADAARALALKLYPRLNDNAVEATPSSRWFKDNRDQGIASTRGSSTPAASDDYRCR